MDINSLPPTITGPAAWTAADLTRDESTWLVHLDEADITDLEQAARHYLSLGRDIGEISKDAFPLERFGEHLKALQGELLRGNGIEVLRGLPIDRYSQAFAATVFCGIGAHLGSARSQNAAGHILGHVRDVGRDPKDPNARIYQTSARQTFHTDSADVVGLMCLREAKTGGQSLLVSATSIYNRMREARPDLAALLFDPVATDRRGEVPDGAEPYMTIPPLNWHEGFLTVFYQRQYINSGQRFQDAPHLTPAQVEALDMFDTLANDPELHFAMQLEPGDLQFVYNHSQLHDRTAFVDWEEPAKRRHLMRLWLSVEGDRPLPQCFKQRYGSIQIGERGGIVTDQTRLHAPIDEEQDPWPVAGSP